MLRFILAVAAASAASAQTTWYVDVAGTPPGSGTQDDPYTSIQYAIDEPATLSGDTLLVAPGTYYEALDYGGKGLAILGDPADRPVIDAQFLAPVVSAVTGEPAGTALVGFVLTGGIGGDASAVCDWCDGGAGVYLVGSSLRVEGCRLAGLGAGVGGAVLAVDAALELVGCELEGNMADLGGHVYLLRGETRAEQCTFTGAGLGGDAYQGGAFFVDDAQLLVSSSTIVGLGALSDAPALYQAGGSTTLRGVVLRGNVSYDYAGAVAVLGGELLAERCTFEDNLCTFGWGAGLFVNGGRVRVVGSTFAGNDAAEGGAVSIWSGALELRRSTLRGNVAYADNYWESGAGGALFSRDTASVALRGCLLAANLSRGAAWQGIPARGGAVAGPVHLERCTLVDNQALNDLWGEGGGVFGAATVVDSIVYGCFPDGCAGGADVRYSLVGWGVPGEGNIGGDPRFVDPLAGDYHLDVGSPCVDAGDPASALDLDVTRADMGAFPYAWSAVGSLYCAAVPNSTGLPAAIQARGSDALAEDWLRLDVTQLPPERLALFLFSAGPDFVPGFGGGQGNLCLAQPLHRLARPGDVLTTGSAGALDLRPALGDLPNGVVMQPGETWHWQLWFRDEVGDTSTSNTSDAVAVLWQ